MVMKRNKIILMVLISILIISIGVVAVLYLIDDKGSMSVMNGGEEIMLAEEGIGLTEEQYQSLKNSIRSFDQMSNVERKNAWMILNLMDEIGFIENRSPGESGVGRATGILEMLDIGVIQEIEFVRIDQADQKLANVLVIRIISTEGIAYYLKYSQTSGLGVVTVESEGGEMIYNGAIHTIIDGKICELEYPRGPVISCRE